MKELIKNVYKYYYPEDFKIPIIVPKSNREKLLDLAYSVLNTDPTPKDEQPDEFACVHSLTTILRMQLTDFPIMVYTPILLGYLKEDKRFKASNEFKAGSIIISPTNTGNGSIVGHTGIIGRNGEILSNSSATGLWSNKYTIPSWIERYSRQGRLSLYIFELI